MQSVCTILLVGEESEMDAFAYHGFFQNFKFLALTLRRKAVEEIQKFRLFRLSLMKSIRFFTSWDDSCPKSYWVRNIFEKSENFTSGCKFLDLPKSDYGTTYSNLYRSWNLFEQISSYLFNSHQNRYCLSLFNVIKQKQCKKTLCLDSKSSAFKIFELS